MRAIAYVLTVTGFMVAAIAVSTAENSTGEKFTFCMIAGVAGLILLALGVLCARYVEWEEDYE